MATMKWIRFPVVAAVLSAIAVLFLSGCELFVDPAAPPFDDRIALTRRIDDVFALSPRGGVEMTVVDNGSGYFLLMRGPGRDGTDRVVAFDSSLRVRMNRTDLWAVPFAAPDANGDFVVGNVLFSGSTFALANPALPVPGDTHAVVSSGLVNGIITTEDPAYTDLRMSRSFDDAWGNLDPPGELYPLFPDLVADPDGLIPLGGFELVAAQHDPGRDRSGVILWNQLRARHFVVVLARSAVADPLPTPLAPPQYFDDIDDAYPNIDETAVVLLPTQERDQPVFYTRRGIVVVRRDGDHEVYSLAGNRTASYRMDGRGDFDFAYAPDGRWMFFVDRQRGRLFRASTWW